MIGYLFLAIALAGGVGKAYCGKFISRDIKDVTDSLIVNMLRMILCVAIGFFAAALPARTLDVFLVDGSVMFLAALSGFFSAAFIIIWVLCVKTGAYAMVDTFVMAGTLIPLVGSAVVFGERVGFVQWLGFAVVVCGVVILSSYNNSIKQKMTSKALVLLLVVGLSSGLADFTQKIFASSATNTSNAVFNFYTYIFSALFMLAVLIFKRADISYVKMKLKSVAVYIVCMAAGLFINSYFKTEAAKYIEAAKMYPLNQGAALFLGMIMAAIFFKERITSKCVIGLLLGFVGICIINMT